MKNHMFSSKVTKMVNLVNKPEGNLNRKAEIAEAI